MEMTEAMNHVGHRPRRGRRWLLPALVAGVMVGSAVYFLIPTAPLEWSMHGEWKAKPVYETTLERSFGRGWRNLGFEVSAAEESLVTQCVGLMRLNNSTFNGVTKFSEPVVRETLEEMLWQRPGFFYAEYALGLWHKLHGDAEDAERYFALAYRHAPVVLVQQYRHEDGKPLANTAVGTVEIECNRVKNRSLDPSLKLLFASQVTDERGRIYLPVYDTVYRVSSISYPQGYSLTIPRMGWFESAKVGLLPVAVARPAKDLKEER
jgi:hypothetical protein